MQMNDCYKWTGGSLTVIHVVVCYGTERTAAVRLSCDQEEAVVVAVVAHSNHKDRDSIHQVDEAEEGHDMPGCCWATFLCWP